MNMEQQLTSSLKLVVTVSLIVFVGALFGTTGYFLGSKNIKKQMTGVYYGENQNEQVSEDDNKEKPVDFADWKTYQDNPYSDLQPHKPWAYEFRYPNEFTLNLGDNSDYHMGSFLKVHQRGTGIQSADVVVSITFPRNIYPGTNFQSAWLAVAYDPDIANLSNCQELENNGVVKKMTEIQTINEAIWYKGVSDSAALGTKIESRVYHTFHNDMCYEVSFHLSTANIGNFDPALDIKAVDKSEIWIKMENIFSTFKFTNTDETVDWITYKNKEYEFEVKYPEDWKAIEDSLTKILFFNNPFYADEYKFFEGPGFEDKYKDYAWISIGRYPEGTQTAAGMVTKDTEIKDFVYKLYSKDYFVSARETITGGQESYIFGYKPMWGRDETTIEKGQNDYFKVYLKQNNDIVVISMWSGPEYIDYEELITTFNQILSTFKFIEKEKTTSWTTYNGSETKIGSAFSFKYPSKIWDLEGLSLIHKSFDGCILLPSVLWRNRLVNIISSENITLGDYKARKVKIGIEDNASSIDYYFDLETSAVFSLSMPENKKDKTICEKDSEKALSTIEFKN